MYCPYALVGFAHRSRDVNTKKTVISFFMAVKLNRLMKHDKKDLQSASNADVFSSDCKSTVGVFPASPSGGRLEGTSYFNPFTTPS